MTRLFPRLTALLVLVAMMAATGAVYAAPAHQACVTQMHECEDVPTIAECCCHAADGGSRQSTPPEQRVEVRASVHLAIPALFDTVAPAPLSLGAEQPITISPRVCLLDLTTLFATLLI